MTPTCLTCYWFKRRLTAADGTGVGTCWYPTTNGQLVPEWHACEHQEAGHVLIDTRPPAEEGT